jgi:hypothetical protein
LLVVLPFDECLTACPGVVLTGNLIELVGSLRAPREALLGFHDIGILGPWRGGAPITEESFCASVPPLRHQIADEESSVRTHTAQWDGSPRPLARLSGELSGVPFPPAKRGYRSPGRLTSLRRRVVCRRCDDTTD